MASSEKNTVYSAEIASPASEFRGSTNEDHDIDRFGYKAELKRRFGLWSVIGLSSTIMITWEGWLIVCTSPLINGGRAGAIYGFIFSWLGNIFVFASLSELISMIPTSGGQYHWTYELASPKYRKFVSWITAWQVVVGWQVDLAAVFYLIGTNIQALVILNYPDYGFQRWHGTMIVWACITVTLCINTLLAKLLPLLEGTVLILHCSAFLVVIVPLIYFAPHASAREVFTSYQSLGGYAPGTAFFVGLTSTIFAFLGADGAIHLTEEVHNSRVNVPRALMTSVIINGALGFGTVIVVGFTIGDLSTALQSVTGFIYVDYFARALNSNAFATGLVSIFMIVAIFCGVGVMASASRVTWALARDNGLPGSGWLKKVSPSSQLPLNAIFLSGFISFLLSLINIGSSVAFNAIVSLVVAAFFGSYVVPIAMMTWMRATNQHLPLGPWHLGKWGMPVGVVSVLWLVLTWVFAFFPIAVPVTPETMNWSCLMWSFVMVFGVIWYFAYQRHKFTGPRVVLGTLDVS